MRAAETHSQTKISAFLFLEEPTYIKIIKQGISSAVKLINYPCGLCSLVDERRGRGGCGLGVLEKQTPNELLLIPDQVQVTRPYLQRRRRKHLKH